jgi:hypothetical protein
MEPERYLALHRQCPDSPPLARHFTEMNGGLPSFRLAGGFRTFVQYSSVVSGRDAGAGPKVALAQRTRDMGPAEQVHTRAN